MLFLYHLSTIHGHISRASKKNLNNVIKLAGCLGDCKFDDIDAVYDRRHEITLPTDVRHRVRQPNFPTRSLAIRSMPHSQDQSSDPQQLLPSNSIYEQSVRQSSIHPFRIKISICLVFASYCVLTLFFSLCSANLIILYSETIITKSNLI